jgi:hypothetical protein
MRHIDSYVFIARQIHLLEANGWQCKIETSGRDRGKIVVCKNFEHKPSYAFTRLRQFKKFMKKWNKGKIKPSIVEECVIETCFECSSPATWCRHTQFAGDHYFCDTHAKLESDFGDADSYKFWEEIDGDSL